MRDLVVIFIDRIATKNRLQIKSIYQLRMVPVFFVNEKNERATEYLESQGKEKLLMSNFFERLLQVSKFLKKQKTYSLY